MKIVCFALVFLALSENALQTSPNNNLLLNKIKHRILEDTINSSVECVRGVLNDGLPDYQLPSFNPLLVDDITIDLSILNISDISGEIHVDHGIATDIASFVMTAIQGDLILIPPIFIVNFALHYEDVAAEGNYRINVTFGNTTIWGEGYLYSGVENLNAAGHVRATVDLDGVQIQEFDAPITIEKYNFNISGLYGDEEYSRNLSETLSNAVPEYINAHPEIFSDVIAPFFVEIFNALVNDDAGLGIVKDIVQKCIIDIVFPPEE